MCERKCILARFRPCAEDNEEAILAELDDFSIFRTSSSTQQRSETCWSAIEAEHSTRRRWLLGRSRQAKPIRFGLVLSKLGRGELELRRRVVIEHAGKQGADDGPRPRSGPRGAPAVFLLMKYAASSRPAKLWA
jgi:hypothetical protein